MSVSVDPEVLQAKADIVEEAFEVLAEVEAEGEEAFLTTARSYYAVKAALQESIEAACDAANHVIAAEGYRRAHDYADLFEVLGEEAVLDADLADRLRSMARFRNLLVHRYGEVDRARVWRILTERRSDIVEFFDVLFQRYKV